MSGDFFVFLPDNPEIPENPEKPEKPENPEYPEYPEIQSFLISSAIRPSRGAGGKWCHGR